MKDLKGPPILLNQLIQTEDITLIGKSDMKALEDFNEGEMLIQAGEGLQLLKDDYDPDKDGYPKKAVLRNYKKGDTVSYSNMHIKFSGEIAQKGKILLREDDYQLALKDLETLANKPECPEKLKTDINKLLGK